MPSSVTQSLVSKGSLSSDDTEEVIFQGRNGSQRCRKRSRSRTKMRGELKNCNNELHISPLIRESRSSAANVVYKGNKTFQETAPSANVEQQMVAFRNKGHMTLQAMAPSIDPSIGKITEHLTRPEPHMNKLMLSPDESSRRSGLRGNRFPSEADEQVEAPLSTETTFVTRNAVMGDHEPDFSDNDNLAQLLKEAQKYSGSMIPRRVNEYQETGSSSAFLGAIDSDDHGEFDILGLPYQDSRPHRKGEFLQSLDLPGSEKEDKPRHTLKADFPDRRKRKQRLKEKNHRNSKSITKDEPEYGPNTTIMTTVENIQDMFLEFWVSSNQSVEFPPMDKESRKVVHEFARVLNIKSTSKGIGERRHPCLYKSRKTPNPNKTDLAKMKKRLCNRIPHPTRGNDALCKRELQAKVKPTVKYKDGEIVGATAPELGTDNRGHAMLEKMGWSTGTALGADNNKGIMRPVAHAVKNGKAGLG